MEKESRIFLGSCLYLFLVVAVIFSLLIQITTLQVEGYLIHGFFLVFYIWNFRKSIELGRQYRFYPVTKICNRCEREYPEEEITIWTVPFLEDPIVFCQQCLKQYRRGEYDFRVPFKENQKQKQN